MKLLITGGCGFLGSNLALDAMGKGDQVVLFDNLFREGSRKNLELLRAQGPVVFEYGDIRNANDITRVVKKYKPEAIFHLAGQVAMTTSIENPALDFAINAQGTHHLLEAVRKHAPEAALLYSSTNKVCGDLSQFTFLENDTRYYCAEKPEGFDENTPLDFQSPYGCSKGAADQYLLDYARIFGLKTVVFRHSSMYGGRQFATYDQGWIGWFCQKAVEIQSGKEKMPITISGTGKQVRDVLHAEDMKRLYRAALDRIEHVRGHAFNVGGGMQNSLSLIELFHLLEKILDIRIPYTRLPERQSDQLVFVADGAKARRLLGWAPEVSMESGIRDMVAWVKSV
jgi:CDP-paratose 2-epimerase